MIDFSSGYSYRDILEQMMSQVPDDLDKREGSLIQTAIAPNAWYLEGLFLRLAQLQSGASISSASGEDLDLLVANRGIERNPATPAVRVGTFDAVIPSGSLFKTINGADSVTFRSGDLISASGSVRQYKLTCTVAGTIGNAYTGAIIPSSSGIPNLTTATIGEIITEGTVAETDASLRLRYLATFEAEPYGGNLATYRQAITAISGVGAVQVYPANAYLGGGTVLCSIINSDYAPASQALVTTVQNIICPSTPAYGFGIAPIGAKVDIVSGTGLAINVTATVVFASTVENGVELYGETIEEAIGDYIKSVARSWGTPREALTIDYPVTLYASRMIYAIIAAVPEVVSVSSLTINGVSGDLALTETSSLQQVPIVGEIVING